MPTATSRILNELNELKRRFDGTAAQEMESLLDVVARRVLKDVESLVHLHEALMFVVAYPQSPKVRAKAESALRAFSQRVTVLRDAEIDLSTLEHPDVSGIAGTSVTDNFSYETMAWLARMYPRELEFYWEWLEDENRLGEVWQRFMPLLEEDSLVEANVPYRKWLDAARGKDASVPWLLHLFRKLPVLEKLKAELYNSQKLYVTWTPSYHATRTGLRLNSVLPGRVFYHRGPLIQRRDVNFKNEVQQSPAPVTKLTRTNSVAAINLAREASTVRYRELYGFTHADPDQVFAVGLGRGVVLLTFALPPEKRLPLRAYHAAMIFKNGVPVGYFEGLSLFERMESGFNLYYTFREGETAWLYAQTLNHYRHLLAVTTFSIDPYQVGHENEEGIESGAFWFYWKLGFRSTDLELNSLAEHEQQRINNNRRYRTSAAVLRKLARASMVLGIAERSISD
ncbi:MAG: hypothetical protein ABR555_02580, partial [Pyrinomonadaceae bacterium]